MFHRSYHAYTGPHPQFSMSRLLIIACALGYVSPKTKRSRLSSPLPIRPSIDEKSAYSSTSETATSSFNLTDMSQQSQAMPTILPYDTSSAQLWNLDSELTSAYVQPFQDVFFSSLDSFNASVDFMNSDAFLGPQLYAPSNGLPHPATSTDDSLRWPTRAVDESRRKTLIKHFVESANPISVILPTHSEWTSACRSLLAMANDSTFLLSAISSLSALHLYNTEGEDSVEEAFQSYKSSSRNVNEILDGVHAEDHQLKQAFATLFLLTHVEVRHHLPHLNYKC